MFGCKKIDWPKVSIGWQVGISSVTDEIDEATLYKTYMRLFNDAFDTVRSNSLLVKGFPLCSPENGNTFTKEKLEADFVGLNSTSLEDAFKVIKSWGLYPKTALIPGVTD